MSQTKDYNDKSIIELELSDLNLAGGGYESKGRPCPNVIMYDEFGGYSFNPCREPYVPSLKYFEAGDFYVSGGGGYA